jgi:dGTPase
MGHFFRLAKYAAVDDLSRGRFYSERFKDDRPCYERDRDRVIHCAAFRRLEYKTQVFVNHEGDYYRTRLTHSIEVAQIARGIAKQLGLNLDLAETLALSHDLGHTPFGHVGEKVLDELTRADGGFEHNRQSLRVVTVLERRYPEFPGLNLTWEAREGIIKHSTAYDRAAVPEESEPDLLPTLEAQIINLADEIAYHNHDLDDGTESGLLSMDRLREVPLWREVEDRTTADYGPLEPEIRKYKTISSLIGRFIGDLVAHSRKLIADAGVASVDDVRRASRLLVSFSPEFAERRDALQAFLFRELYQHPHLERMRFKFERTLRALFEAYREAPKLLPPRAYERARTEGVPRAVCDHIAGMTDRFALNEYRRLFDPYSLD